MSTFALRTDRLDLRVLRASDLDWMARLHGDPEVMRFIRPPDDRAETQRRLDELLEQQESEPQLGVRPAVRHDTGDVIGWFVLTHLDGGDEIEVGYRLFAEQWGQGFATEGCRALSRWAFDHLGTDRLVAVARFDNLASQRVLEKSGYTRRGDRYAYGLEVAYFVREAP